MRVALHRSTLSLVQDREAWEAGIISGVNAWSVASGGSHGSVIVVGDPLAADIEVALREYVDDECGLFRCLGEVSHESRGRQLLHAGIVLYPQAGTWSRDKVAQITVHEMGHALGLMLHSPYPADIMYGLALPTPVPENYPWITQSDLNTLKIAYCKP